MVALLVREGEVVDFACNNGVHAEYKLAQRAGAGSTILVYRFKKDGSLGWSKPCEVCRAELIAKGIGLVGYIDTDERLKLHRPVMVVGTKPKDSYPQSSFSYV